MEYKQIHYNINPQLNEFNHINHGWDLTKLDVERISEWLVELSFLNFELVNQKLLIIDFETAELCAFFNEIITMRNNEKMKMWWSQIRSKKKI